MKVCFINPPSQFGRAPLPHMGIAYIGGMLKKSCSQVEVDVIDCPFQNIDRQALREKISAAQYQVVGITTYFYNFTEVFKLVRFLNQSDTKPFIVLGGYYPTLHPQKAFNIPGISCICIGEGEYVWVELIKALLTDTDWRQIHGLAYLNDKNELVKNPVNLLIEDLNALPEPYIVEPPLYWYPLVSGRGCHGHCTFCSIIDYYKKVPGKKNRKRSPAGVVRELKHITAEHKNKVVWMMDDNFFAVLQFHKNWIDDFVRIMKEEQIQCKFKIFARADELDKEILLKLKSVGLMGVVVGIESMVDRQLKLYGKHTGADMNRKALDIIKETGIYLDMGFIILDPFTTLKELRINLDFLKDSPFVSISEPGHELISSLGPLIVLEDTPIHRYLSKLNILSGTDVGYNFESKEITFFHKGLKLWNKKVSKWYFDFNHRELFTYYDQYGEIKESYPKHYQQCLRVDIAYMCELLELIETMPLAEIDTDALVKKYQEEFLQAIHQNDLEDMIEKLLPILKEYCIGTVTADTDLYQSGLNSIHAVHVLVKVEKLFHIKFKDHELHIDHLSTARKLAQLIKHKMEAG